MKIKNLIYSCLVISVLLLPISANAAGLVNCGNGSYDKAGNKISDACTVGDLFVGVIIITNFLIAFAGLVAVFFIILSGFRMVTAAGNPGEFGKARKGLAGAVIGFVLTLIAFLLINTLINGPLNIGIENGGNILSNPLEFINRGNSGPTNSQTPKTP